MSALDGFVSDYEALVVHLLSHLGGLAAGCCTQIQDHIFWLWFQDQRRNGGAERLYIKESQHVFQELAGLIQARCEQKFIPQGCCTEHYAPRFEHLDELCRGYEEGVDPYGAREFASERAEEFIEAWDKATIMVEDAFWSCSDAFDLGFHPTSFTFLSLSGIINEIFVNHTIDWQVSLAEGDPWRPQWRRKSWSIFGRY